MNNLDICKRIAKIEGLRVSKDVKPKCGGAYASTHTDNPYGSYSVYNPLTNDALCFKLMVKYKLSLIAPEGEQTNWDCVISHVLTCDENPNKAICLAIIEANKGK